MIRIPNNAKKVFEGVLFDVYQWPQEMFDGSTRTFEMLKRKSTGFVIGVTPEKTILLSKNEQPSHGVQTYTLFGGQIEKGEDSLQGTQREFLEESGYTSQDWELWREEQPSNKLEWMIYTYIARNCKKVTDPIESAGERIELLEVDFDEFVDLVTAEGFHDTLLSNAIFRMQKEGTLEAFKQRLMK